MAVLRIQDSSPPQPVQATGADGAQNDSPGRRGDLTVMDKRLTAAVAVSLNVDGGQQLRCAQTTGENGFRTDCRAFGRLREAGHAETAGMSLELR